MKKILIIFILLLSHPWLSQAQNWELLKAKYTHYYTHSDSLIISNIVKVDSSQYFANDSIYHLCRRLKVCDTCTTFPNGAYGMLYEGFASEFLGYSIQYNNSINAYVVNDDTIYPLAQLGDSWNFNTTTIATVINTEDTLLFGILDSVKTIALTGGDTLILSKEHGLIRYPDFNSSGKYFDLVGLQYKSVALGEYLPNVWTTYDFSVGNIYSYYLSQYIVDDQDIHRIKLTVLEDFSDSAKHSYSFHLLDDITYIHDQAFTPWDIWYGSINRIDTASIMLLDSAIENTVGGIQFSEEAFDYNTGTAYYDSPFFYPLFGNLSSDIISVDVGARWYKDSLFGYVKRIDQYYHYQDSLFYKDPHIEATMYYANNLGRVQFDYWDFEYGRYEVLKGFVDNGDTTGVIYNLPDDLSLTNEKVENPVIYPNPVSEVLHFSKKIAQLEMYDINGKLLLRSATPLNSLDVTHLNNGLYYIVTTDQMQRRHFFKVVVQH